MRNITLSDLGVNKGKLKQFEQKKIYHAEDLIHFLPREIKKIKLTRFIEPSDVGHMISSLCRVLKIEKKQRVMIIHSVLPSGQPIKVLYFGSAIQYKNFEVGEYYQVVGEVKSDKYTGGYSLPFPQMMEKYEKGNHFSDIWRKYSSIPNMSHEYMTRFIEKAIDEIPNEETLPLELIKKYNLLSKKEAYYNIHFGETYEQYEKGMKRHKIELLYQQAMYLKKTDEEANPHSEYIPKKEGLYEKIIDNLPFELTEGQQTVLDEYYEQAMNGKRINSLLQGDVGSGKTITAILIMAGFVEKGYQCSMLAPTSVLAEQHYEEIKERLEPFGVRVGLLNGNVSKKKREKNKILKQLANGEIDILVGTHSIIQEDVIYKELSVAIVDEEHRFGVVQRETLSKASTKGVHMVRMSATPIPRSLALTMYSSSMDIHSIKTKPVGRKPVITAFLNERERVYTGIEQQVMNGNQVYVVCPLIEESEAEAMEDVKSVEETYAELTERFRNNTSIKIGMLNGKMKPDEVEEVLGKYERNEYNVLISTTVIEVGINVPNATLIVIQNAERFGLAQLHQLRGRVGRSSLQSYCVLESPKGCLERLYAMTETNDGFEIAEIDYKLRGGGEISGERQSGKTEYIRMIEENVDLFEEIKEFVNTKR